MSEAISWTSQILATVIILGLAARFGSGLSTFAPSWLANSGDGAPKPAPASGAVLQVLALCLSFATLFSLNQFFGLEAFVPALLLLLAFSWRHLSLPDTPTLISFALVAVASALFIVFAFHLQGVWMREGANHDLILYTRGGEWALEHGTLARDADVSRAFSTGRGIAPCFVWIGDGCILHRGGAHTLSGLQGLLNHRILPASVYLLLFPLSLLAVSAFWINATGPEGRRKRVVDAALVSFMGILLCSCGPILGALWNGNVATAAGALILASAVLVFVSPASRQFRGETALILGCLTGLAAHVYSEAMWFTGAITAAHVVLSSAGGSGPFSMKQFFRFALMALGAWLIAGNMAIIMALTSLITVSNEVSRDLPWSNYFLEVENWRWLSIPFSGHLHGWNAQYPSLVGAVGTLLVLILSIASRNRVRFLIPMALVAMAVLVIEKTNYYYGVHKVVQLFGPIVVAVGLAAILQLGRTFDREHARTGLVFAGMSVALIAIQVHSNLDFSKRTRAAAAGFADKAIMIGDEKVFERLTPGAVVLLNDLSWSPSDRFSKTNWIDFLTQHEGAQLALGDTGGDAYRGAYVGPNMVDTLRWADEVDWVVQAADLPGQSRIVNYEGAHVYDAGRFELVDLRDAHLPAVFQGIGWQEREAGHYWTSSAFTLDVFGETGNAGAARGQAAVVDIDIGFFNPPQDGMVSVFRNGQPLYTLPASTKSIRLPVIDGYQTFEISPSWQPQSPAGLGLSADSRELFASVNRITSRFAPVDQEEVTDDAN